MCCCRSTFRNSTIEVEIRGLRAVPWQLAPRKLASRRKTRDCVFPRRLVAVSLGGLRPLLRIDLQRSGEAARPRTGEASCLLRRAMINLLLWWM